MATHLVDNNPNDAVSAFGKAFQSSLTIQKQIPELPGRLATLSSLFAALDNEGEPVTGYASPDYKEIAIELTFDLP